MMRKSIYNIRYILILIISMAFSLTAKATLLVPVTGSFYTPHGSTPVNINGTSRSAYVSSDVSSPDVDLMKRGVVTLGIDHHHTRSVAEHHTVVGLSIKKWATLAGGYTTVTTSMDIDYKPHTLLEFNDSKLFEVDGVLKYEVTVTSITVNGVAKDSLPANVFINLDLYVNRVFDFGSEVSGTVDLDEYDESKLVDRDCDGVFDDLLIEWDRITGAEEYQLEWTFVNDYTAVTGDYKDDAEIEFDFKHNSTRILTVEDHYNISLIYPHGYIIYRIRAVGRLGAEPTKRVYTQWSSPDVGNVQDDANDFYPNEHEWEISKNWQYSATFAEEGKKKEVVSFFDGSLRNRQMVTVMNSKSNNKAIVGETIYDHIGRPAVQVLPVPVLTTNCETSTIVGTLKYYQNFNMNDEDEEANEKAYSGFDLLSGEGCEVGVEPMSTLTGASRYYSGNNPELTGSQGYLPDAQRYPFSQVQYTPDNTGRISRQGGVGEAFQLERENPLDDEHASEYFYAHPSQLELDRMFGSEVGDATHYQKNMVIDPNGQVSVSYLDQEGRVIATSLAGNTPDNVSALASQSGANVTMDESLFGPGSRSNVLASNRMSAVFNATVAVSSETDMTFDYAISVSNFTDPCFAEDICFDCIYDLTIEVTDDCGESMLTTPEDYQNLLVGRFEMVGENDSIVFNVSCELSEFPNGSLSFTIYDMPVGTYQVTKTLSINEDAMDFYEDMYLNDTINTCFKTLEDFENEFLLNVDLSGCITDPLDCQACIDSLGELEEFLENEYGSEDDYYYLVEQCQLPCQPVSYADGMRTLLLNDVKPNGQYGEYLTNGQVHPENFILSVYNVDNELPRTFSLTPPVLADWQEPVYDNGTTIENKYFDANLVTESKVQLFNVVMSGSAITSSEPEILNGALAYYTYDVSTDTYWTVPQNLAHVADFIAAFASKPSWAYSLIYYHPEYNYLKLYQEFEEKYTHDVSSESFDSKMEHANTWQEAIDAGLIKDNYDSQPVTSRLEDYTTVPVLVTDYAYDPFTESTFSASMGWTPYSTNFVSNVNSYHSGYHMVEIAAMIGRCGNQYGASLGSLSSLGCLDFGKDATGGGSGGTFPADILARDKDWQNFKSLYRSLKQQYQADLNLYRVINEPLHYGYNDCIGNSNYLPHENGFLSYPFGGCQYLNNNEQPCYYGTAELYEYKQKRFVRPTESQTSDGEIISSTDPYSGLDEAGEIAYNLTGNCPASISLAQLINDLRSSDNLDNASYSLTDSEFFIGYLLSQQLVTVPVTPLPSWTWEGTVTGATLDVDMMDGVTLMEQIQLIQDTVSPVAWSTATQITDFHASGTGGLGFEFTAQLITATDTIDLLGSTTIDILNCTFDSPCTLNSLGSDLHDLLNIMTTGTINSTSPITIHGTGSTSPINLLVSEQILEILDPVNLTNTAFWTYNSGTTTFEISTSPSTRKILLDVVGTSGTFTYPDIKSFPVIDVIDENTFVLHGYDVTNVEIAQITIDVKLSAGPAPTDLITGICTYPAMGCDDQAVVNAGELEALLDDVLVNQNGNYDLFASTFMTTNLASQFEDTLTLTTSIDMDTLIFDDGYSLGTTLTSQTVDTVGAVITIVTIYQTVSMDWIRTYTETVVCEDGDCVSDLDSITVGRSFGKVTRTTISIGTGCDLILNMDEDLVYGSEMDDIGNVLELIPSGEPDFDGNYHEFDLVVSLPYSAIDTLHGSICIPLRLCDTLNPFVFPTVEMPTDTFVNPCVETAINIALSNAGNAYNTYIDSLLGEFRADYARHCMSALENMSREYEQREYHHTLYYYDQAGNLIKTVPPEGVDLLPITSSNDALSLSIANDRTSGTHTVLTSHRMETRYTYNSLNQLVAQHMPDQEDMSSWTQTLANGLDVNLSTTGIHMLDASVGYLTGYITTANAPTGSRGYLYKTTDGGANWTRITNLFPYDLARVKMATSTNGFAVGKSGVALRTLDGGTTWDLLDMHSKGIISDFVDVAVQDGTNAAFLMANGHIVPYISSALGNEYTPTAPSSTTGSPTLRLGNSIVYNGSSNVYAVDLEFVEGTSPDTLRFTQIALVNISTPSTTYETVNGSQWNTLMYASSTVGVVASADGDILFLKESGSSGTGSAFLQSANIVGNIVDLNFLDKTTGVAVVDESGSKYFYKTTDGGINWTKVSANTINSMGIVSQTSTNMYVLVSFTNNNVLYYDITNGATTTKWTHGSGYDFDKITGYYDGTNYFYYGVESGTKIRKSASFSLTGTTAPASIATYVTISSGTAPVSMKIMGVSPAVHVLVVMNNGDVHDGCSVSGGAATDVKISSSSTYKDIALGTNGGTYVLAYENSGQKLYRLVLTGAAPSSGSLAAISGSATTLPGSSNIIGMALHADYVTLIASTGKLYSSTTTVSKTSTTNLAYADRSDIRLLPIRSISPISFTNASVNYNAIAVGDRGMVIRRTTSNVWKVTSMGLTVTASSVTFTPSLKSVATATVSSTNYAIIVGQEALRIRLALNAGTTTSLTTASYSSSGAPTYTDAAINSSGNAVLTVADGKAFYCSAVHSGTTFTSINTSASALYGVSLIPSSGSAIVVGNTGIVGTVTSSLFTQTNALFGPKLNSVHFGSTAIGTVAGDNFFVRSTINTASLWSRVLPATVNSTNLTKNVTDVWTRPTNTSAHYAVLGGASYLAYSYGNVATPDAGFIALALTVNDIQFSSTSPNTGYIAAGAYLKKLQLTVSGATYTTSITNGLSAALSGTINAMHVFTNGSNTSEIMLVGNSLIEYKAEGSSSTISLLGAVTGNIRDVVFSDRNTGYIAGDAGLFYKTDVITYNTGGTAYTAMSWLAHDIHDANSGTLSNINVRALEFPSASKGVWGGYYTSTTGLTYAAVRSMNVLHQTNSARFYYDRLGRIVVSQNSRQYTDGKYSYSLYDVLGRVYEAGEKTENTAGGGATFFTNIFGTSVGGQYIASVIDDTKLNTWITTQSGTTRKEVTKSYYDGKNAKINANGLSAYNSSFFNTATQRKRIVHVTYEETFDVDGGGNPIDSTYDHATHYNYDIHGNVTDLLQENKKLRALTGMARHRYKEMDYVFDLISGNVHRVDYESGDADQWHHAYQYDADNRITDAYTTTATPLFDPAYGMIEVMAEPAISPYWTREVTYAYYDHGPLARTLLGNEEVQGLDYVYTLQGWIKGVNSNDLDVAHDPGMDGKPGEDNHAVARDVMSYSLNYYGGDFVPANVSNGTFVGTTTSSDLTSSTYSKDMYNGNIARMVTTITNPNTRAILPLGTTYKYDQLNRLTQALSFTNFASNAWGSSGTGIYGNYFAYDANGNITKQLRKDSVGTTIDSLSYKYHKLSNGKTIRNRLYHVDDNVSGGTYSSDVDDMGTFAGGGTINTANNYVYDQEGRLIKDVQEGIATITWRVDGKVKSITRPGGSSKKNITFEYDAMGHRIAKHIYTSANVLEKSTYYILDAQGNTMSTYDREIISSTVYFTQREKYIYGSSRLGVLTDSIAMLGSQNNTYSQATWSHVIGKRYYEMSNHLGNVLSTISDKPIPVDDALDHDIDWFLADIRQAGDYSPFGVQLSGRNFVLASAKEYRHGFHGMEEDDDIKGDGNSHTTEYRFLDPRLGKWLSLDPLRSEFPAISPYAFSFNSPLKYTDKGGDRPLPVQDGFKGMGWRIDSGFGSRNVKGGSKYHKGADINSTGGGCTDYGAPVLATHDGYVSYIHPTTAGGAGRYITVTSADGTFQTQYFHLSATSVKVKDIITESQEIGKIGSSANGSESGTACHLHYEIEIFKGGKFVDMDPQLDSDDVANTNNNIKNLVDPQRWVTGEIVLGTRDEPMKTTEIEEIIITGYRNTPVMLTPKPADSFMKDRPMPTIPIKKDSTLPTE